MRRYILAAAVVLFALPACAFADDEVKPEQLKKMYDDALGQLKAAQDRKAELAKENEALTTKVQELQKQLAAAQDQVQSLKHEVADNADRTYYLRAYHAAWQHFLNRYPELMARWKVYLGHSELTPFAEFADFPTLDLGDLKVTPDSTSEADARNARWPDRQSVTGPEKD